MQLFQQVILYLREKNNDIKTEIDLLEYYWNNMGGHQNGELTPFSTRMIYKVSLLSLHVG